MSFAAKLEEIVMKGMLHGVGHGRLALPIVLMFVGYFIPAMRTSFGAPMPGDLWMLIALSVVILLIWIVIEFLVMSSRNTSITALQLDSVCSAALTITVSGVFGFYVGCTVLGIPGYALEWWLIVPWIGCMIDAGLSAYLAINNAAQKPYNAPPRDSA